MASIGYSMGPITGGSKVIDLGGSYAFGFTLASNSITRKVYAISAIALGQHEGWTAQILDPPVVSLPAQGSARVIVQVTSTNTGDQVDPPRCEVVLSAVDISQPPQPVSQARLMLMALKAPPTPDPRVHVVLKDPGGINNRFASGVQPATLPVGFDIFVTEPGNYTVTAQLRDPAGWAIQNIYGSPFQVNAGSTTPHFVAVGPLTHNAAARETDLYLTVAGGPGISAQYAMPIIP